MDQRVGTLSQHRVLLVILEDVTVASRELVQGLQPQGC